MAPRLTPPVDPSAPPWLVPAAAYLHVPFCAHHCGYCDFAVTAGKDHLMAEYVAAITRELTFLNEPSPVDTIFLGGGTPTYLDEANLRRLLTAIRQWLPPRGSNYREFTIESTPESITAEKIAILAEGGVNRISVGVQSFQSRLLPVLERIHAPEHILPALEMARKQIPQVSLDLIFGIPGQTLGDWEIDLSKALECAPNHLSTYGLTFEKGTPLWKQRERGLFKTVEEELELQMYLHSMDQLPAAGFEQYEISNFARLGCRSIHNETYWSNHAYFGFGVGAARYVHGVRELNVRDTELYLRRIGAGESAVFQSECLLPEDRARETIAVQLRRCDGIHRQDFQTQTGFAVDHLVGEKVAAFVRSGQLDDDGIRIRLSRAGKCVADSVIAELM